jgi:protein-disulfide isomerase
MTTPSRPSLLRALAERKTPWLAVPAVAALIALVLIGRSAVTAPVAEAETSTLAMATAPAQPVADKPVATAVPAQPAAFTPDQKKQIEGIIKSYLVANPEIFLDVQTALEDKMEKEQAEKLKVAIADNAAEIYRQPDSSLAGNPDGDITVVEFFDYNCGYCKRGLEDVAKLVETDPKVRVVFKELPILSKGSEEAARVALAAKKQGADKYWAIHKAMLGAKGHMDEAAALRIAEKQGLDMDKLKADMAAPEIKSEIEKSEALAKKMGVNGTPHFLIGDRAIPGAPEDLYQQLSNNVQELRKKGCSYC